MADFKKLSRNIDIRRKAEQAKEFVDQLFKEEGLSEEETTYAWTKVLNEVFGRDDADEKMSVTPMSYNEARRWYHTSVIGFGQYKSKKVEEVPFSYLEWLADQPDFRRDLCRFLDSEFVKSQQFLK